MITVRNVFAVCSKAIPCPPPWGLEKAEVEPPPIQTPYFLSGAATTVTLTLEVGGANELTSLTNLLGKPGIKVETTRFHSHPVWTEHVNLLAPIFMTCSSGNSYCLSSRAPSFSSICQIP
ncbi:hypothetical protein V6N13_113212 [Hibiscus sabdariffa]